MSLFGLEEAPKVFLYAQPTDMRKGFDGLYGLVLDHMQLDPFLCHEKTNQILTIDKIMTFAPAHDSDLLKVGKGIDKFLSLLRNMTTKTGWGYALALPNFHTKPSSPSLV